MLGSASRDGVVRLWNLETATCGAMFTGHKGFVFLWFCSRVCFDGVGFRNCQFDSFSSQQSFKVLSLCFCFILFHSRETKKDWFVLLEAMEQFRRFEFQVLWCTIRDLRLSWTIGAISQTENLLSFPRMVNPNLDFGNFQRKRLGSDGDLVTPPHTPRSVTPRGGSISAPT